MDVFISILKIFSIVLISIFILYLARHKIEEMFRWFVKHLKSHSGKLLFLALTSYAIWLTFVMIKSNTWFKGEQTFDLWFPERTTAVNISFWQSVASSTLDSVVFLLLITSVLALRSLRDPREEDYKRKIQNLFPEIDMHSDLGLYLQKKVSFLACVSPSVERVITIDKISNCDGFIHMSVQTDCDIKNIHHNHSFSDELRYSVTLDNFALTNVDYYLKVLKMRVIKHRNGKDNKKSVLLHPVAITPQCTTKSFNKALELELTPYETATYLTHSLMWQDLSKPLTSSNVRYTMKQKFVLKNETDKDLFMRLNQPIKQSLQKSIFDRFGINLEQKKEKLVKLKADTSYEFTTGEVEPGEKVSIEFSITEFTNAE